MAVRKTERKIPLDLQPSDLGQAVVAADGRCALVSFVTAPLVVGRENAYVVFITDAGLAAAAHSFEWTFAESAGPPEVKTTEFGESRHTPASLGILNVTVRILNSAAAEQTSLSVAQAVVPTSAELETMIAAATNEPGPTVGSPEVLRELINEHNLYYQSVALQTPEPGEAFKRFVYSMVYDGVAQRNVEDRQKHLEQLALSLNDGSTDFGTLSSKGAGVCGIRPLLLAMIVPGMVDWTLLPEDAQQRSVAREQLQQKLASLAENNRIDLYNLVRFPKTNITFCGSIMERLRNEYFNGTNFDDVLAGMSGVRAQWIIGQFQQGPITRNP